MTSNNFDELTKNLACSTSRRQALKTILVGSVGSALGFLGLGTAQAAGCLPNGVSCTTDNQCCSHDCFKGTCSCKPKGIACKFGNECCTGNCTTKMVCG